MKLTEDEKFFFEDLVTTDYWPVVEKVLDMGLKRLEDDVLSTEINSGDRPIALARSRLDGAQKLRIFINQLSSKAKKGKVNG